ncbi:Histone like [Actinidia chinensis var. chinensis]|uniref:Histone like n=1 Tax=Actinidia chinensis var. chinensis TaxID=1590841 RepID=A0A2R6Q5A2_ACTCC|nr:Histone like [Actinidia chinensis var. chinensis]
MMSIALESSTSNRVERAGLRHGMSFGSVYESPEIFDGYRRLTAAKKEEEVVESSSSSSVGRNSDLSGGESNGDGDSGEGEIQSSYKAPLDNLDALEEVLPMKRSISKFYCGKSKSFTSLADAVSCSSVKEIVKPENAYTRKRKILLAHSTFWDKNRNYPPRSNSGSLSKRPANSRSTLALVAILSSCESNTNSENHNSNLSPPTLCRPPLYPHGRRSPNNQSLSSASQRTLSSWRSFSLSDLQCATATAPSVTGLVITNENKDMQ